MSRKNSNNSDLVNSLLSANTDGKKNYRQELANREPEMKKAQQVKKDRSWAVESGSEPTEFNNPIARSGSSVRPARCASEGGITDMGGPTKQVNVTGKNSIWDSEVLTRLASTPSSKERVEEEKQSSSRLRELKQAEYKQSIGPRLGDNETVSTERGNSVTSAPVQFSRNNWVPAHKHSIFDTNDNFDRLTALNERVNPTVPKEEKTVHASVPSKSLSSKEISAKFVDGISNQEKNSSYKSVHNDAVDRLYKILQDRNSKE